MQKLKRPKQKTKPCKAIKQITSGILPLIRWTPCSFPIFPSMVLVHEWQVIPSTFIFSMTSPAWAILKSSQIPDFFSRVPVSKLRAGTSSTIWLAFTIEGIIITTAALCWGEILMSVTPFVLSNVLWICSHGGASEAAAVRNTVSVKTGSGLGLCRTASKPMSSMASCRVFGVCSLGS